MKYHYLPLSSVAHARAVVPFEPAAPPAHRVIVPMRDASESEQGRIPDIQRLSILLNGREGISIFPTYAMAEEIATATLMESVALRFVLPDGRRGVALWWDWRWHGAIVREIGALTLEHLEALITGAPWPPPSIACPRCGAAVRANLDGSPRAHGKKRRCKGYWPSLMDRSWGLPIRPEERIAG